MKYLSLFGIIILISFTFYCSEKKKEPQSDVNSHQYTDVFFIIEYPINFSKSRLSQVVSATKRARLLSEQVLKTTVPYQINIIIYESTPEFCQHTNVNWWKAAVSQGKTIHLQPPEILSEKGILPSTIAHEYAYFAIKDICANGCPLWLKEGIASYIAKEGNAYYDESVEKRIINGKLFRINELDSQIISSNMTESRLAYWQAFAIVDYLIKRYGEERLIQILGRIDAGESTDAAFQHTINLTLSQLEKAWRNSIR
jgi:hypothetical protein